MSRLLLVALAAVALAPLASAQDADSTLTADARALLFQVGPDLTLSSFSGSTASYKWHKSPTRARRLGLTLSGDAGGGSSESTSGEIEEPPRGDTTQGGQVSLSLLYLTYHEPRTPVRFYHGLGPRAGVSFDRRAQTLEPPAGSPLPDTESTRLFFSARAGITGAIGVEWVVHPAIGLTAEYTSSLVVQFARNRVTTDQPISDAESRRDTQTDDRLGVSFGSGGGRLGLSVYF